MLVRGVVRSLGSLLPDISDHRWDRDHLYVEGSRSAWSARSAAAVVDCDPHEDPPPSCLVDGVELHHVLSLAAVEEIVVGLRSEFPDEVIGGDRFAEGLRHYHEFDGFLPGPAAQREEEAARAESIAKARFGEAARPPAPLVVDPNQGDLFG